jgi:hypothetical protein
MASAYESERKVQFNEAPAVCLATSAATSPQGFNRRRRTPHRDPKKVKKKGPKSDRGQDPQKPEITALARQKRVFFLSETGSHLGSQTPPGSGPPTGTIKNVKKSVPKVIEARTPRSRKLRYRRVKNGFFLVHSRVPLGPTVFRP